MKGETEGPGSGRVGPFEEQIGNLVPRKKRDPRNVVASSRKEE